MPNLRQQSGPLGRVHAVLGEDVAALPISDAIAKLCGALLGVPVEERQVDPMLSAKMAHGVVDAGANNPERGLLVAQLVKRRPPLPTSNSSKSSIGMPSRRNPWSAATSSDSVELCEAADCLVDTACKGNQVFGPTMTSSTPVVLFLVSLQDAKSASVYSRSWHLSARSPTYPIWYTESLVECT